MSTYFDGDKLDNVVSISGGFLGTTIYEVPTDRFAIVKFNYHQGGASTSFTVTKTDGSTTSFSFSNTGSQDRVFSSLQFELYLVAGQKLIAGGGATVTVDIMVREYIKP